MYFDPKNWLKKHLNAYFFFVALAFMIGAYVFLLDSSVQYVSQTDILISAKNEKTALNLDKIRENLVFLVKKNESPSQSFEYKIDPKNSIIELEIEGVSQTKATEKSELLTRNFIDSAGRYYDGKTDLGLEVVYKNLFKKEVSYFGIFAKSLLIGLILSFIIQLFLDFIERMIGASMSRKKELKRDLGPNSDLESVLKFNSDRIRKLSSSFSQAGAGALGIKEKSPKSAYIIKNEPLAKEEAATVFKKAASPINLPTAIEDVDMVIEEDNTPTGISFIDEEAMQNLEAKAFGSIVHSEHEDYFEEPIKETILKEDGVLNIPNSNNESNAENNKVFKEPTEEDFKRKLNQLLGNR